MAAGSFTKRLGVPEGTVLKIPTIEFSYKNDEYHDPLINHYHALAPVSYTHLCRDLLPAEVAQNILPRGKAHTRQMLDAVVRHLRGKARDAERRLRTAVHARHRQRHKMCIRDRWMGPERC